MDTSFIVGGKTIVVPPMPFLCLEAAWPSIEKLSLANKRVEVIRASLGIVAAATLLSEEPQDENAMARVLQPSEYDALMNATTELMGRSGLEIGTKGEAEAAAGSTAIGDGSSPN